MNSIAENHSEDSKDIHEMSCTLLNTLSSTGLTHETRQLFKGMKAPQNNISTQYNLTKDASMSSSTRVANTQPENAFILHEDRSHIDTSPNNISNCPQQIFNNNPVQNHVQSDEDVINVLLSLHNSFFTIQHPKERRILPKIIVPNQIYQTPQPEKMIRCSTCKKRKSVKCFGEKKNGLLNRLCLECSIMKCKYYDAVVQKQIKNKSLSDGSETNKKFKLRKKKYNRNKIKN